MAYQIQTHNFSCNTSFKNFKELNFYLKENKKIFKNIGEANKSFSYEKKNKEIKKKFEIKFDLYKINLVETCDTENYLKFKQSKFINSPPKNTEFISVVSDYKSKKNDTEFNLSEHMEKFGNTAIDYKDNINLNFFLENNEKSFDSETSSSETSSEYDSSN